MTPAVSIIVPNFNHKDFLQQRLTSILDQSFQDFEVILLDDASTDTSVEILNSYKDHPKVSHLIINENNSGSPFIQWIKGIKLAKAPYIWIAESDDFAEIDFLKRTVSALKENPLSNLAYVDSRIVDKDGIGLELWSERKNNKFNTLRWTKDYQNEGMVEIFDYLLFSVTINNTSAVLFNKNCLNNEVYLNELSKFKNAGDLYTYIHVASRGRISYVSQPLNNYREHEFNVTKVNTKNGVLYFERILCFKKVLSLIKLKNLDKKELYSLKKTFKHIVRKNGFKLVELGYKKELTQFIKQVNITGIFNKPETMLYILLYKTYNLKGKSIRKLSKNILKRSL